MLRWLVTLVLLAALICSSMILAGRLRSYPLPGNQQGYEPVQPIAFSHRVHAGEMQISCLYCHSGAEVSKHAGIPPESTCMDCHQFVTCSQKELVRETVDARKGKRPVKRLISPELQKLYNALGLDEKLEKDPTKKPIPIAWVKVHNLPAFTCFDHRAHIHAGVSCQHCHGPVETMERIRQAEDLSMGWCVNCHRQSGVARATNKATKASTDCVVCHY